MLHSQACIERQATMVFFKAIFQSLYKTWQAWKANFAMCVRQHAKSNYFLATIGDLDALK
jgi:hypothetical protein